MDINYQELYGEAQSLVWKSFFQGIEIDSETSNLKLPDNYKDFQIIGVDKIKLAVPSEAFTKEALEKLKKRNWRINLRGDNFTKIISGEKNRRFWCYLEFNPAKILYGNNIRNVRDPELMEKATKKVTTELAAYGYEIDIEKCTLYLIEANKIIILNQKALNQKTITILTDEVACGHHKKKSSLHKEALKINGFSNGTSNNSVTGYDKVLEIIHQMLKKNKGNKQKKVPVEEIRKIAKDYPLFLRLETTRGSSSLKTAVGEDLIKMSAFLKDPGRVIDKVFNETIESAGFTESNIEVLNDKKVKNLSLKLKRYIKMYERSFITRFLKDYQSQIWGLEQLNDVVDHLGGKKRDKYNRKISFKKNYKQIKNTENTHLDAFEYLKNIIENI